jgi:hypothetical protein
LISNFVEAILDGTPLVAPGESGVGSVELANVMLYSGLLNRPIELPMNGADWEAKLNELMRTRPTRRKWWRCPARISPLPSAVSFTFPVT